MTSDCMITRLYALSSQMTDPDIVQKTGRPIDRDIQTALQSTSISTKRFTKYINLEHQLRTIDIIDHSGIAALK
jgi:hypothetical protein